MIKCHYGCDRPAVHTTKKGLQICATHHRKCPVIQARQLQTNLDRYGSVQPAGNAEVRARMAATNLDRYGVINASSSPVIKRRRLTTIMGRYGVDNAGKIPEVRTDIGAYQRERWRQARKDKEYTTQGLSRTEYSHRVHQYSLTTYLNNIDKLDPQRLRGYDWHLDHVFSVEDGFRHDVPINVMGHLSNLRLIPAKQNYAKHSRSEKSLEQLYEDFYRSSPD